MIACAQGSLALIGDIGGGELLLVFAAILMLFGGKKLPSIARSLGKTVEDLRRTSQDFREQLLNADRELEREGPAPSAPEPMHRPPPAARADEGGGDTPPEPPEAKVQPQKETPAPARPESVQP